MRLHALVLALPIALASDHPLPTPRPTITPAPKSQCEYKDEENGPFALDCLQAEFLTAGCSMRGTSYPTEVDLEAAGDKGIYNGMTWGEVKTSMAAISTATDTVPCRGPQTPAPTPEPTASPTTRDPTPAPTRIPTTETPAPTYAENVAFVDLVESASAGYTDDADAAEQIKAACIAAGYGRQYDDTQYVVELEMGDFKDYYTIVPAATAEAGQYTSVCDMLGDPVTNAAMWSSDPNGPFRTVDLSTTTDKGPDNRVFPSWLDSRGSNSGQGYGASSAGDMSASGDQEYTLRIAAMREFSECIKRVDQQKFIDGEAEAPCNRPGADSQVWSAEAKQCDTNQPEPNLLYSIVNMGFATCDSQCVYHPDFDASLDRTDQRGAFWKWIANGNGGCWKARTGYSPGEYTPCDPANDEFASEKEFADKRTARLCTERCDHVQGWRYLSGSCFRLIGNTDYDSETGDNNFLKANAACGTLATDGTLASIGSETENGHATSMCGGSVCYIGNDPDGKDTAAGGWLDGSKIVWANWEGGNERATAGIEDNDYLTLTAEGTWAYTTPDFSYSALCKAPANNDGAASNEDIARFCMNNGAGSEVMETNQFPQLDIDASGFTDASNPGDLHLIVTIPKYFYNAYITFENSTSDAAEYNWNYGNSRWVASDANTDPTVDGAAECENDMELEATLSWVEFNLGGAGGVQRLASWEDPSGVTDPDTDLASDNYENSKYLFGSVMRIAVSQPVFTDVSSDNEVFKKREAVFERTVVARIPFILQFQKTVTVSTDVDIISTKFNYKTVAAIIQSVQYDTQFFAPPYAKIKLQIRTKSQYPYLFNKDVSSIVLHPVLADTNNDNVDMSIAWLADDANCTFTNPDHMREGDICTQEWMLTLIPDANVCYATGEYSIQYEADCFYGKDVCYLPLDADGEYINTVTFTFKVQTSKFCPTVADEVDLSGTLSVVGRESFKPDEEGLEDNTDGSFYLQGEKVNFFATTASEKATITSTSVVMVEIEQNLDDLVMTGYNRVPYDNAILDMTIWTPAGAGRIADGTVSVDNGAGAVDVLIMEDSDVYNTGATSGGVTFGATEAGFSMLLDARVFPVNVDSFGQKKVLATLAVDYQALNSRRRRRLLSAGSNDFRTTTSFRLDAWKPAIGEGNGDVATMKMELTLGQSMITRTNVMGFVESFEDAVVTALKAEATERVYSGQVVVEAVYSKDSMIWSRPNAANLNANRRKLLAAKNQKISIVFSLVKSNNGMTVKNMVSVFDKQLRQPSSPLMVQPIFYGSVIHTCVEVEAIQHRTMSSDPSTIISSPSDLVEEESSAVRSIPVVVALLSLLAMW